MGILVSWHQPKAMKAKNSVRFFSSWMHRDGWRFKRYNDEKYWPSLNLLHARTKCEFQLIWKRGKNRIGSKIATSIEEAKKFKTNRKSRIKWTKEPENNNKCNKKNDILCIFFFHDFSLQRFYRSKAWCIAVFATLLSACIPFLVDWNLSLFCEPWAWMHIALTAKNVL